MAATFSLEVHDRTSLGVGFAERGLSLAHFETRAARKRANNGLEEELYILRRYLFSLEAANLLAYPFRLEKGETPDFTISTVETSHGIEITEATFAADQREMTLMERSGQAHLLGTYGGRYKGGIRDASPLARGRRADRDLTADALRAVRRKKNLAYITPSVDLVLYANGNANQMSDFNTFLPLLSGRSDRWGAFLTRTTRIRRIAIMKESKLILWAESQGTTVVNLHDTLSA